MIVAAIIFLIFSVYCVSYEALFLHSKCKMKIATRLTPRHRLETWRPSLRNSFAHTRHNLLPLPVPANISCTLQLYTSAVHLLVC